jgi:FKBP-type peptidyl-prolyl cis-trans isomerase
MKKITTILFIGGILISASLFSQTKTSVSKFQPQKVELMTVESKPTEMTTKEQQVSYIIGFNIGINMKQQTPPYDFDAEMIYRGLKTAFNGAEPEIQPEAMQAIMQEWQMEMQTKEASANASVSGEEKAKGQAFLEKNKTEKGVIVTPSGLQYKVEVMGKGPKPAATDKVNVHYEGTLIDGTIFDSSYKRGEPISFPLNGVIKGWTEGLQLMPVGSTFIFYIPSDLAYGDRGAGGQIPGGATLIFKVELLGIE